MNSLEVLLNAEQALLDPTEPYNHNSWNICTCGHIYHGITGVYNTHESEFTHEVEPYTDIFNDIVKALDIRELMVKEFGKACVDQALAIDLLSDYTEIIAKDDQEGNPDGWEIERHHALKVIQEAIEKIRARDNAAMLKVIDPHTYELNGS